MRFTAFRSRCSVPKRSWFNLLLTLLLAWVANAAQNQLPRIIVHPNGHFLQTEEGRPFFWLGDTAWELIHRTTREECSYYLHTRSLQGFTVIQTVVLAEFNGVTEPSALGEKPFINNDLKRPNDKYFDRVREIVDEAGADSLYVALLPTWGDKLTAPWGAGPRLFRLDNLSDAPAIWRGNCKDAPTSCGCSAGIDLHG